MSENDLHLLFAEAILSGRPALGLSPEIITGLAPLTVEQSKDAYWKTNARLSLLIREAGQGDMQGGEKGTTVPLRQLIEAAETMQDVTKALSGAFRGKLQASKFLSDSSTLYDNTPLVDMGVDSLVAVEVRPWFLKELAVDVPVMTILGGAAIADLVGIVMQKLPQDLQGRVDPDGSSNVAASDNPENDSGGVSVPELKPHGSDMNSTSASSDNSDGIITIEEAEHKAVNGLVPVIASVHQIA